MMDFAEWSLSIQTQIIYLTICISVPSMALYIAQIVTIVRHKKFHNSFYVLFVMRAIPDCLGVLNSFYGQRLNAIIGGALYPIYSQFPNWMFAMNFFITGHTFQANFFATTFILLNRLTAIAMPTKHEKIWQKFLPLITIFVYFVPTLMYWPAFKMNAIFILRDPNSTTDRGFYIYEAGDNVSINGNNNGHDIEKKLLCYALATFLGHAIVAIQFALTDFWLVDDPKTRFMFASYFPLIMDTGTVMLSGYYCGPAAHSVNS
uniref:Serpentine receptor class gamma n=1 Tax=Globodera rostochiensis TaxID=31243 RepID=A0A914HTG8_GLORO